MNIERGMRRTLVVITVPLSVLGIGLTFFGFGKAYIVNRHLDAKINAYLEAKDPKKPPFDPSKPYEVLNERGQVVRKETGKSPNNETMREGPWVKYQQKWDATAPDEPTWNDLSDKIKNLRQVGVIGLIFVGLSAVLWGLFIAGRWIAAGLVS